MTAMDDHVDSLIEMALAEDIGPGDVTSEYFVPFDRQARAVLRARGEGVISGLSVACRVFRAVDATLEIAQTVADGSHVAPGAVVLQVSGKARSILTAERVALNFVQRLSGVASSTAAYVAAVKGTRAKVLDTRKTTPGYRFLEKQAVLHGGGVNHRMGLYDRAMVKDNHLVAEGGLAALQDAIRRLKSERPGVEVELEADRLDQVRDFLTIDGIDHILLDNMTPDEMRTAVEMRGDRTTPSLEASGGVNLQTIASIAATGVDFVSVGAITHSAPAFDVGLDFISP